MNRASRSAVCRIATVTACAAIMACGNGSGPGDETEGTTVTFSFCTDYESPVWVAVQDGSGPWTRVLPVRERQYQVTFTSTRGGIATVPAGPGGLHIRYGDLTELSTVACSFGYKNLTGTFSGVTYPDRAEITMGGARSLARSFDYILWDVLDGPQDLFAARKRLDTPWADRIIIRRDQDLPDNTSLAPIAFESDEAFEPALATFTANNAGTPASATLLTYWYGRGTAWGEVTRTDLTATQYAAVPLDRLAAADLSSLDLYVFDDPEVLYGRYARNYFRAPTGMVINVGPVLSTPAFTEQVTGSRLQPTLQLPAQAEYGRMAHVEYRQAYTSIAISVTSSYLGTTPATWNIAVPDLSSVDGWNEAWSLSSSAATTWYVMAQGGPDRNLGDATHDGDVFRLAELRGGDQPAAQEWLLYERPEPPRGGFPRSTRTTP